MIRSVSARFIVTALFLVAMSSGCSYPVMPKRIPAVKASESLSLESVSVIVKSVEKDDTPYSIRTDTGRNSGFTADRKAWSRKLVEVLARELARRGAQVRGDAPVTVSVLLPGITVRETRDRFRVIMEVSISSSSGWSKVYEGAAETSKYGMLSPTKKVERLAGTAMAGAVGVMLNDAEFQGQILGTAGRDLQR